MSSTDLQKVLKYSYMDIFTNRFNEVLRFEQTNQSNLANRIGISRQCITDYKSGKSFPTIQTLARICTALDTSSDYLLGLTSDEGAELYSAPTAAPIGDGMTADERELLRLYRELTPYLQGMTMEAVKSWAKKGGDSSQKSV